MARTRPERCDETGQLDQLERIDQVALDGVATTHRRAPLVPGARWLFWLMFAINVVNYLDRLIAVAVGPTLKLEFNLSDRDIGLLSSAFLLVYTLAALPLGLLADRARSRARIVTLGVGLWSAVSGLTALARGFGSLLATRALVGVGEASYYPAGTALLSAYFPREARARVMGRWQAGQLVGALLAFLLAGALFAALPAAAAWRLAFILTAIPGLALAALMWRVADAPGGGTAHGAAVSAPAVSAPAVSAPAVSAPAVNPQRGFIGQALAALSIPSIWVVIALQALIFTVVTPAITFLPIYIRSKGGPFHLSAAHAALLTGLIVVVGGLVGALLGGPLADWLRRWFPGARALAAGVGMLLALPCYAAMLLTPHLPVFCVAGTLAVLALNLPAGPLTAIPQDVAPPHLRATVVAVTMVVSHLLGDVWSPTAVGALSSALNEHTGVALLLVGIPALVAGALIALVGARIYARNVAEAPDD